MDALLLLALLVLFAVFAVFAIGVRRVPARRVLRISPLGLRIVRCSLHLA